VGLGWAQRLSGPAALLRNKQKIGGLLCGLGQMLEVTRKNSFEILGAEMDEFKRKFDFE
jgi:hypothetical protein